MNTNLPENLFIQASKPSTFAINQSLVGQANLFSDEEDVVLSQAGDIETHGIAGRIWEAAYAMIIYLTPTTILDFDPRCSICAKDGGALVELGAGNGFLGFKLAQILSSQDEEPRRPPKTLVLTDLENVCRLLERNRFRKFRHATDLSSVNLVIQPLEWGNLKHGWRVARRLTKRDNLANFDSPDALSSFPSTFFSKVYFPELFAPLLRTLLQLSSPPFSTVTQPVQIIISYMIRSLSKEIPFWNAFGAWFNFSPVLFKSAASTHWGRFGDLEEDNLFIFVATRKPETLDWTIPDDSGLLRLISDTFETLLFMNISCGE